LVALAAVAACINRDDCERAAAAAENSARQHFQEDICGLLSFQLDHNAMLSGGAAATASVQPNLLDHHDADDTADSAEGFSNTTSAAEVRRCLFKT
jgi:hypothetical protein